MGQCYTVTGCILISDDERFILSCRDVMLGRTNFAKYPIDWSLSKHGQEGTTPDSLEGVLRIIFAGWKNSPFEIKTEKKGDVTAVSIENYFDATYGWESVMMDMTQVFAPFCNDESFLVIDADDDIIKYNFEKRSWEPYE